MIEESESRTPDLSWQQQCVGRDETLKSLQECYDGVAQVDKNGRHAPQFRILLGLTGIGKTRIAQEHYRWLTHHRDTDATATGYWPDSMLSAYSDGANPHFDLSEDRPWTEIPFLWWGLKFESGNQAADALYTGLKRLPVHTFAATAKRMDKKSQVANWKRLIGLGLDFVPIVKEVKTGIGLAQELGNVLTERSERLEAEKEGQQNIAAQEQRERRKHSDTAIECLRQFLDDRDTAAPTVPVVLFLDDAHWVDPVTMQFVSELWQMAVRQHWPLMVIATHWASEQQNLAQFLEQLAPEPRQGVEVIDIHGVRDDKMERLVRKALPGVTDDQVALLLDKACADSVDEAGQTVQRCSPNMITMMIEAFTENPRKFFINEDVQQPLTDATCNWVKDEVDPMATLDPRNVIRKRFEGFDDGVQLALGWSSLQGRRFLVEVTQEITKHLMNLDADAAFANLQEAEDPRLWVERIPQPAADASRFNLCAFRLRAFQEVAAKHFVIDDEERTAVDRAVSDVLTGWLEAGRLDPPEFQIQQNGHGLTREELRDLLVMAVHRFTPKADGKPLDTDRWGEQGRHADARLCGLAAAKLSRLNADEGLWEQAEEAALKFAEAFPNGCPRSVLSRSLQIDVIDLLHATCEYEHARRIADSLVEEVRPAIQGKFAKGEDIVDFMFALERRGDSELSAGNRTDAKKTFRELAYGISEWQDSLSWGQRAKTISLSKVGDVELAEGNRPEALKLYRESLEIGRQIVERFGESPQSLRDVAILLPRVGDMELADGNRSEALKLYRESLEIGRQIVERFRESPQSLRDVRVSLERVGGVELAEGNRSKALELYRESLENSRQIVGQFGESPQSLRDVSVSLDKVGGVELADGNRPEALKLYRESLEVCRQIVKRFEGAPKNLRNVSVSLERVGDVELAEGNRSEALDLYRESLEIRRQVVERFGKSPQSLRDVSVSLTKVGDVELAEGNRSEALDLYRESLEIRRQIVERVGESPQTLRDVSISLTKVGDVELVEGNRSEALELHRESLEICRQILEQFGESPQSLRDVSILLYRVSDVELAAEGNRVKAMEFCLDSLKICRQILEQFGESPQSLRDVSVSLEKVGDVELAEGNRPEALEFYRESLDIRCQILEQFGESPESLRDASVSQERVANVELAEGNRSKALEFYRESLEIRRQILELFGRSPESYSDLVVILVKMSQVEPEQACQHLEEARDLVQLLDDRNWLTASQRPWIEDVEARRTKARCD